MTRNIARNSKKQLGTKNGKAIGAAFKKFGKTLNPWGPNVPQKTASGANGIGQTGRSRISSTTGSSTKKPVPDSSLRGMQYPKNDPLMWPVEPDFDNHTLPPSQSGITQTVIDNVNASIEHAYTRDGYQ